MAVLQHRWPASEKSVKIGSEMRILGLIVGVLCWAGAAAAQPDPRLIEDLVAANRVLADLGVVDGFGHVSARHDKDPNRYVMARSLAVQFAIGAVAVGWLALLILATSWVLRRGLRT